MLPPDKKQLLTDFYAKYAPKTALTEERLAAIENIYGSDNERFLQDLYKKYAPDQEMPGERVDAILSKYGLKKKDLSQLPPGVVGPTVSNIGAPDSFPASPPSPEEQQSIGTDQLEEQLRTSSPPEAPATDFGGMPIEDIEAQMRAASEAPPTALPSFDQVPQEPAMAFDRPGQLNVPASEQELKTNQFEAKKTRIKDLIHEEDQAKLADSVQKYSDELIGKIDKEIKTLPNETVFEDTGAGGVSSPKNERKDILNMAKDILEEVKNTPDQGDFIDGLRSKGFVHALPFIGGMAELPQMKALYDASQQEAPTKEQGTLLTAQAIKQQFEQAKQNPSSYRWGQVLAEMLPYMGEYAATAGVYSGVRASVTTGLKTALKGAAEKAIIKNAVIKPISTLAALAAQTSINPTRVEQTTLERMTPQIGLALGLDDHELKGVVGEGTEGFTEAFTKAFGVNAMELLTERFGKWSTEAADAMKISGKWMPQLVLGKWMEKRGFANLDEAKKVANQLGWDGVIKEIWFEEYPNKILQNAITGDEKFSPEFFNPLSQEFIDMVIPSILLGGGPMAAGAVAKFAEKKIATPQGDLGVVKPQGGNGKISDVEQLTQELKNENTTTTTATKPAASERGIETPITGPGTIGSVPEVTKEETVPREVTPNTEKVEPVRGAKQIAKSLRDLDEAKYDIAKIDAIHLFDINVSEAPESATAEEKAKISDIKKELEDKGYKIGGNGVNVGQKFDTGLKVLVQNSIADENLEEGKEIISKVYKPVIFKDGKMVRPASIQVSVGTKKAQEETFGKEGKFKVVGKNSEGETIGEDKNGVRARLTGPKGNIIVTQAVGVVPTKTGVEVQSNPPEGEFLTTEESKLKQQENAIPERSTETLPMVEASRDSQEVVEGVSKPKLEETPTPQKEKQVGDNSEKVVKAISDAIGKEKMGKKDIEAIGQEYDITDKNEIKELTELAIVQKARELAAKDDFEGLVKLYNDQPSLTHRTNESIQKQQYSTPAPIAYLGGKYINADQNESNFEPSAGNGMLTIVGNPKTYTVNEIDEVRLKNLETQGFAKVLRQSGAEEFNTPKTHDAVITNPPFGGTSAIDIEGFKFNELAQIMAVRGLNTMKDNGKAFIIIGGNNKYDEAGRLTGRDRIFFNYLYNRYNVDDVIDITGDIYRKQGASFPIRVILVNGRKPEPKGYAPLKDKFQGIVESFEELHERVQNFTTPKNENLQPAELVGKPTNANVSRGPGRSGQTVAKPTNPVSVKEVSESSTGRKGVEESSTVRSGDVGDTGAKPRSEVNSGSDIVEQPVSDQTVGEGQTERPEPNQPEGDEGTTESRPRSARKVAEGDGGKSTVTYNPLSKGSKFDLQSPAGMKQEVLDAQTDLENDVGDVDDFVQKKLGYKTKDELYKALGAEQIDGVALAIRNIERGTGIIIGDQTGVGKGRQAAAIIRYGIKQKLYPIFLTEKPNLFSDLYRDLLAIGSGDVVPFIVNSRGEKFDGISDENGKLMFKAPSMSDKNHKQMISEVGLPNDAQFILATYSQFSSPRYIDKINFLKQMSKGNIIILDESHNASGEGNTSQLFQEILPNSKGVVYLSGTFAKRADNMPVYALKTSMREANMSIESLIGAVESGGVALQEIISSQLAQSGEMIRRERTFEGIDVKVHMSGGENAEVKKTQLEQANKITNVMNDIIRFQKEHIEPVIKKMDQEAVSEGVKMGMTKGTNMAGVDNTPYFSKVFNVVNQLLYALKAKDTADLAISELKAGRKPFIAIRSTMESMLKDLVERGDVKIGDALDADFRFILKKGLEGVMKVTETSPGGDQVKKSISPNDLFPQGQKEYKYIMSKIAALNTGLTISPIDEFIKVLTDAGYKVGEVTGRQMKVVFKEGKAILDHNKKQPVNELYRKYNNGEIDVLIVNSSGSTGASAHSDKKFKDQRQRSMLVLEPELNISTLVQLLGRVNRTNQVNKPQYTFISSHIPAEQRLMMMTMRKLKSLSANTTSNQKQSNSLIDVPEIFNKYGDEVVIEYLQENPELIQELGNPLKSNEDGTEPQVREGAANKVTGRVAILPTDKQAAFYSDITDSFAKYLQFLDDAGMNDLQISSLPLRAKTTSKKTTILGKGGISKFGEDTYLEEVDADVLKKPMTSAEIKKSTADLTENNPSVNNKYKEQLEDYKANVLKTVRADAEAKAQRARDKAISENGNSEVSVESLEAMTNEIYEFKAQKEEAKIKFVDSLLNFFRPGKVVKVPFDFNAFDSPTADAIFLGFDINTNSAKPFLPSKIILKFAVNDSRRLISIPASKGGIINTIRQESYNISSDNQQKISSDWDNLKKPKARGKRFIVTGNILQGLGNSNYKNGQIVKYTTEAGPTETGILMNESFNPADVEGTKTISVPANKAVKPIISSSVGRTFTSTDTLWTVKKVSDHKYSLRVPKPKATGGKYYTDDAINDLVDNGRWDSVGNEMETFTDESRLDELLLLLSNKFGTAFNVDAKDIQDLIIESSQRSAGTYEKFKGAMGTFFPMAAFGKVKKNPTNKNLLAHLNKKNLTEKELEAQLDEEIKLSPEVEKRFKEAGEPAKPNMTEGLGSKAKEWVRGFTSHFRYLNEKKFPREANILREFEGLKVWANGKANIYIKGLIEPLTKQQYTILSRRIILADLLESIQSGLNMTGIEGKLPFGFGTKAEVQKELKKYEELSKADPAIELAYDKRNDFMQMFKESMINSGLLTENEIDNYYHRRVLTYQSDEYNRSILFGKTIGDKRRDFQKKRTGTRGLDYSTNFIETEFKVVAEGLFELEKQKQLKDLMEPYENELKALVAKFNREFNKRSEELATQYGENSIEVEIHDKARRDLKKKFLEENIPAGYVFYRVSEENRLFWGKTVSQQVLEKTLESAQAQVPAMDVVDELLNSIGTGLMVGAKRKQYMVPEQLAEQLEFMAKDEIVHPATALATAITSEWKKLMLLSPFRFFRYNLNNLGGDIDRTLQVDAEILKYGKEAANELWDFTHYGNITPTLSEAMRGSVIDSGFEISELADLTKQQWATHFLDKNGGPDIQDIFGKKWAKDMALAAVKKPGSMYDRYMEWAGKYARLRENVLRYAAYKLALEKQSKGQTFYWASSKSAIDAIPDKRQRAAKLAREVYGDYANISYAGKELRKFAVPFYSWLEINMGTTIRLLRNANSPSVQRAMARSAIMRGIPAMVVKIALANMKLALFTAMVQAWNEYAFGLWGDDDAAEKLRRANLKGMQILMTYDDTTGHIKGLPVSGTFYDFLDFFGIPGAIGDVERMMIGKGTALDVAEGMAMQMANRTSQMMTPAAKIPVELASKQSYFPDMTNPLPFDDRLEYLANVLTLKDEYNYLFTNKPKKESYLSRKWNNSLLLREFDPNMLAYYKARNIIADLRGEKTSLSTPQNPDDAERYRVISNWALAMRYGHDDEASKILTDYVLAGNDEAKIIANLELLRESAQRKIKAGNPFVGLRKEPRPGEPVSEYEDVIRGVMDPKHEPETWIGKQLTPEEFLIIRDAFDYWQSLYNHKSILDE